MTALRRPKPKYITLGQLGEVFDRGELSLGTSTCTVPVQGKPTPTLSVTPTPSPACTYSLEIREHGHSLTTYQLSLETLAKLVLTVGRQFAEEQAAAPAWDRHSLYMEIRPEISTAREGI